MSADTPYFCSTNELHRYYFSSKQKNRESLTRHSWVDLVWYIDLGWFICSHGSNHPLKSPAIRVFLYFWTDTIDPNAQLFFCFSPIALLLLMYYSKPHLIQHWSYRWCFGGEFPVLRRLTVQTFMYVAMISVWIFSILSIQSIHKPREAFSSPNPINHLPIAGSFS